MRLVVGPGYLAAIYGLWALFTQLPRDMEPALRGFLVGAGFGTAEAIAGAYKDGSIEGFSIWKFLKSPSTCAVGGLIAAYHTDSLIFLMLAAYGSSRMFLELFFKILRPSYSPGKFQSTKPSFPEWSKLRVRFLLPYGVTWLFWLGLQAW